MTAVRTLVTALGAAAIILGFLVVPPLIAAPWDVWGGEALILFGWTLVVAMATRSLSRYRKLAVGVSSVISVLVGFSLIFGLGVSVTTAPRTLGAVAVALGALGLGWIVLRGRAAFAPLLAGSLAFVAIYGQTTVTVANYLVSGSVPGSLGAVELANFGRWSTLAMAAFLVTLISRWRGEA